MWGPKCPHTPQRSDRRVGAASLAKKVWRRCGPECPAIHPYVPRPRRRRVPLIRVVSEEWGPEMAPHSPPTSLAAAEPRRSSKRCGRRWWAPKWPPIPPTFGAPRGPRRSSKVWRRCKSRLSPHPQRRSAAAEPRRSSVCGRSGSGSPLLRACGRCLPGLGGALVVAFALFLRCLRASCGLRARPWDGCCASGAGACRRRPRRSSSPCRASVRCSPYRRSSRPSSVPSRPSPG